MDKAFTEEHVDKTAVLQAAEKIADVKGTMFVQRIGIRLDIQAILTADQIDVLKRMRMERIKGGMRPGQKPIKDGHGAQGLDGGRFAEKQVE